MTVAAVVVAGGAARRFGGIDKLTVCVDGMPVLARVLTALRGLPADEVVVVGPRRPGVDDGCVVVRESPPGGGPLAAIAAGLAALGEGERVGDVVVVVAGDLPHLTPEALGVLVERLAASPSCGVAMATDDGGRAQYLLAAWRREVLLSRLAAVGDPVGQAVRTLTRGVEVELVEIPVGPAGQAPWQDLDERPGSVDSPQT